MFKNIFKSTLTGLFTILPIVIITLVVVYLFEQISLVTHYFFNSIGIDTAKHPILWMTAGIAILAIILTIIGELTKTRLSKLFRCITKKIPIYSSIKDMVNIFNSSKENSDILVVAIKGFTKEDYNIGLMYSVEESVIKEHYTVTLSMSPIPNGGFIFEVHRDRIFVIENAKFNDNLNYLLSMGSKSLSKILEVEPQKELMTLTQWLEKYPQTTK